MTARGFWVVGLKAENFKRIQLVELEQDDLGQLVELRGKNDQGKSSIMDAIQAALLGLEAAPERPVREGAQQATIKMTLGPPGDTAKGVVITRTFDVRGKRYSSLTVAAANGAIFRSPQHLLKEFYEAITLDPLEFGRLKPADRIASLAKATGIDLSVVHALEAKNRIDYDLRTTVNRDARVLRGKAAGIQFPEDLPAALVDEAALAAALAAAGDRNAERERQIAARQRAAAEIAGARDAALRKRGEAVALRAQADELDQQAAECDLVAGAAEQHLARAAQPVGIVDTSEILAKLAAARDTNRFIGERQRREELEADAAALDQRSTALTEAMRQRDAEIRQIVAAAKMPVDGLALGEDDVLLNGIPYAQLSSGVKIKTSAAIAMAAKPRIRVVCVRDGALLDDENFKLLAEMTRAAGYQLWIEVTDSNAQIGFIIEDGRARIVPPTKTEERQQGLSLGL